MRKPASRLMLAWTGLAAFLISFLSGCANESPTSMETALTRAVRAQNAEAASENYQPPRSPGFNSLTGGR